MTSSNVTPLKATPVDDSAAELAHTDSNGNPRPVLQVEGVNKIYTNGTIALKGADLTIRQGEFVSLLGPSGCGKSTLLRIMAGLGEVTTGTVKFWEQGYDVVGDKGRKLAFVFQNATLMPWARVRKNVRLPLDLEHQRGPEVEAKIDDALEMVGLKGFDNAFPRELSGGMQMRASIARAMVTEPNLLLMDEPFGALDEMTRNKLNDDVLKLWQKMDHRVRYPQCLRGGLPVQPRGGDGCPPGPHRRRHPYRSTLPAQRRLPRFDRVCRLLPPGLAGA